MDLKERTKWALDYVSQKNRVSNTKIGNRLGFTNDTINSYRAKLANPKVDFIIKFCDEFRFDLIWFTKGDGEPFPGASVNYPEVCSESRFEVQTIPGNTQTNPSFTPPDQIQKSPEKKVYVDSLAISLAEKSLLNLCKLIGIPNNRGWKTFLAKYLESTPAQLSNCISRNRLSKNLIAKINEKGYPTDKWLVRTPAHANFMNTHHNSAEILKLAEKILKSETIHATSLAMNIISLNRAVDSETTSIENNT
jgi:hypothetical protein